MRCLEPRIICSDQTWLYLGRNSIAQSPPDSCGSLLACKAPGSQRRWWQESGLRGVARTLYCSDHGRRAETARKALEIARSGEGRLDDETRRCAP
jgi:hypothetical protein